jgi:hypothetical protein
VKDGLWPVAGAQVGEIGATLLTFKIRSERLVWGEQSGEPAVSGRPQAALGGPLKISPAGRPPDDSSTATNLTSVLARRGHLPPQAMGSLRASHPTALVSQAFWDRG